VFAVAVVACGSGDIQATICILVCWPLASELIGWKEPSAEWLVEATVRMRPESTHALPLGPGGGRRFVLSESVKAGLGTEEGLDAVVHRWVDVGAVGKGNVREG
jgi:hypothetical protein